jgi:triphosphatase
MPRLLPALTSDKPYNQIETATMPLPVEIELKLAIDRGDLASLRRHPLLRQKVIEGPSRRKVFSLYFDTPGLALRQRRMALRMRKTGGEWLQTLKAAGSSTGGLHQRGEWEFALRTPVLDLSLFAETPLAGVPNSKNLHHALKPVFSTALYRTTWIVELAPGRRVEVALDQGVIRSGTREVPISEVEIELVEGSAAAVFDVALALGEHIPLRPDIVSKAERGYRLFKSESLAPHKAGPIELDKDWPPQQALRVIAAGCLDHFEANVEGALAVDDPEFIHQLRVALRRLRSALRVFKPAAQVRFAAELKWLTGVLGEARDWDVLVAETLPPLLKGYGDAALAKKLLAAAKRRQSICRAAARAALVSQRQAHLVIELAQWLGAGDESVLVEETAAEPAVKPAGAGEPPAPSIQLNELRDFASREIRRRHRRLLQDSVALAILDPGARHQVRIDAKRLRYAVDFFATLFGKRRTGPYLKTLSAIQDVLGQANDAASAERLIESLVPPEGFIHFAKGWFAARTLANLTEIHGHFSSLEKSRHFWPKKSRAPHEQEAVSLSVPEV